MNKKMTLILAFLVLASISAGALPTRLVRLKIINKSGRGIELSLSGKNLEYFYYLRIPAGNRLMPAEQIFTIVPDTYASTLYYVELWDPVYGYQCSSKSQTLDISRNVEVTVLECDRSPANAGETPAIVKYGGRSIRRRH